MIGAPKRPLLSAPHLQLHHHTCCKLHLARKGWKRHKLQPTVEQQQRISCAHQAMSGAWGCGRKCRRPRRVGMSCPSWCTP